MKRYQRISTTKNKIMTGCVSASLIGAMLSFGVPASANTSNSDPQDSNQVNTNTTKQSNPQDSGQANTDTTKQTENNSHDNQQLKKQAESDNDQNNSDIEKNNANENNNNSLDDYKKDEEERIEYGYRPNHWGDVAYTYENGTLTLLGNDSGGEGEISNNYLFDLTKRITENVQKIVINGPIKLPEESNDIFSNLPKLRSISGLNNVDASSLIIAENMFSNDPMLTSVDISGWDTDNLTVVKSMFSHDDSLVSINMNNIKTEKIGNLSGFISYDKNLTTVIGLDKLEATYAVFMNFLCPIYLK